MSSKNYSIHLKHQNLLIYLFVFLETIYSVKVPSEKYSFKLVIERCITMNIVQQKVNATKSTLLLSDIMKAVRYVGCSAMHILLSDF